MDLSDLNIRNIGKNLLESKALSNFVNEFINELEKYLEKKEFQNIKNMDKQSKYINYWEYQNFIEDNVAAEIGLSRWGADIIYSKELSQTVEDSILEISEKEGTIYRKQFSANGSTKGQFYNVDKFENGEITHISISKEEVPEKFQDKDIIFQYNKDGRIKVRSDLKEQVVKLASKKSEKLKEMENQRNIEYKREGHIYEVFEDDGYIFLKDISNETKNSIEDVDFVVDSYKGEGKYQVINGEYKKISN